MREILDYCSGGTRRAAPAGTEVIHEGGNTGHLYVLIEGRLEVVRGDTVVAAITEPGAVFGEMSVLLSCRIRRPCARLGFRHLRIRRCGRVPARPAGGGAADRAACSRNGSMSPTPISPTSSGNMPATASISRWSAKSCRA